jgi:hypothetical protein
LELCRIYPENSEAPKILREFYDYIASLPIQHFLFEWYLKNFGKICIGYLDGEVRLCKSDGKADEDILTDSTRDDVIGNLIDQVFDNQN